ncbi:MAG: asparagine synthase (glutamine-hydrolyzing) [Kofleriaceae bacterium]|nr:asparagine synthase (glutamine-hydrolyzing) [Kofleriaceae bacterium]
MCGIVGIVGPGRAAHLESLEAMTDALAKRGPDARSTWSERFGTGDEVVAFGHRRLSIIDLSDAATQPMMDTSGRFVLVYNGEIYNYRELRDELLALGARFRTSSDTEVLLEGYKQWGESLLPKLNGMFAFAMWDRVERRLWLARDRVGIKPLYLYWNDGLLLFASDLSALKRNPAFHPEVDPVSVATFLQHGYVMGPRSIYRSCRRLMPGESAVWEAGRLSIGAYWRFEELGAPHTEPMSFDGAVDRLEALLLDSVRRQLVADVPVGAFLSGGIDSSTVVSLMAAVAPGRVRTFSVGFEARAFDEAPHARAIASHLGTEHRELYVTKADAQTVANDLPWIFDEPFADASSIPTVLLSRLTREHVTVALSGDGGDELFGGYRQHLRGRALLPWLRFPHALRAPVAAALARCLPRGSAQNAARHLTARDGMDLAYRLVSAFPRDGIARAARLAEFSIPETYAEAYARSAACDDSRRAMIADLRTYLPDDVLTKVDRASMYSSLEARVPILDQEVVSFASSLPLSITWRGNQPKAPLRALLARRVPRTLFERPKQGFALPLAETLERELRSWEARYLTPERLRADGILDPQGVEALVRDADRRSREEAAGIRFRLTALGRWFALHVRGEAAP